MREKITKKNSCLLGQRQLVHQLLRDLLAVPRGRCIYLRRKPGEQRASRKQGGCWCGATVGVCSFQSYQSTRPGTNMDVENTP